MDRKLRMTFSIESFLSHSAGKKLRGTILYSNESLVMKVFMLMSMASQFGRIFLSNSTKTSAGRTFVFQKSSGREN